MSVFNDAVLYTPGSNHIICAADGVTPETFETLQQENPTAKVMEWAEVDKLIATVGYEEYVKRPAERIDAETWMERLEILPPCRWNRTGGYEYFHISERVTDNIVSWFVNDGTTYLEFYEMADAPASKLIERFEKDTA